MIRRNGIVHDVLEKGLGHYDETVNLAREAVDLIRADRLAIKILSRNIESLTLQMKGTTDVTFERDKLREAIEVYEDRLKFYREENNTLRERLKQYEEK
jgi:hypothetical protein